MTAESKVTTLEEQFMGVIPNDEAQAEVATALAHLDAAIVQVASYIHAYVAPGRQKSLAITALEEVQLRAHRGIFASDSNR